MGRHKKQFTAAEQKQLKQIFLNHGYNKAYYKGLSEESDICIKWLKSKRRYNRRLEG